MIRELRVADDIIVWDLDTFTSDHRAYRYLYACMAQSDQYLAAASST